MNKIAFGLVALSLSGCVSVENARQVARGGAVTICQNYTSMALAFEAGALTGAVNATTVRDVRVAVGVLDANCPSVLAGNARAGAIVLRTYPILVKAAAAARA